MAGGSAAASGRLVVLDRSGRAGKAFPLGGGAATVGRAVSCDVRVLLPAVAPHHATLLVHRNQVLIRNEGDGETLVNGRAVSVTALQHNDVITIGGRQLRWEYDDPSANRPLATQPALYKPPRSGRAARRATAAAPTDTERTVHRSLLHHRASMPGHAGGKQVAVVQPQRRDMSEQIDKVRSVPNSPRALNRSRRPEDVSLDSPTPRGNFNKCPPDTTQATLWIESRKPTASPLERKTSPRKTSSPAKSPKARKSTPKNAVDSRKSTPKKVVVASPANTTKDTPDTRRSTTSYTPDTRRSNTSVTPDTRRSATSVTPDTRRSATSVTPDTRRSAASDTPDTRRSSLRKPVSLTPSRVLVPRAASAKKSTPLRMVVLRKARSAHKPKVTKIEAPLKVDHMKQAALMLITGRTPRGPLVRSPAVLAKKRSPIHNKLAAGSRKSSRGSSRKSVSVVEIADTSGQDSYYQSDSTLSGFTAIGSPLLPSPRKSALKDPKAKRSSRKTESIKFDLSNLESYSSQDEDDLMETGRSTFKESSRSIRESNVSQNTSRNSRSTRYTGSDRTASGDDLTLHYTDTSSVKSPSPSPRRSIHSRTSTILELSGSPLKNIERKTLTPPESPSARKSLRGSTLVQKALEAEESKYSRRSTRTLTDHSFDDTAESAFQTRTLSPRSARNLESYSIVDLVTSRESNDTAKSVYDSAGSTRTSSIVFGTPRTAGNRTRSTIDPKSLASSTPYLGRGRPSRSKSSPNVRKSSPNKSTRSVASRRSKSLTTPENSEETQKHISINSTKISRASKSRSRLNDSDLQLITSNIGDGDDSPRTSRRNITANLSHAIISLSPKKASPSLLTRTSSPIISSPKRSKTSSPKKNSPRISNSKQTSPTFTQASPRNSPKQSTPKSVSPKRATPRNSSKQSTPKSVSSKRTTPRTSSPKSPRSKRGSRSTLTLDTTYVSSENEGTFTPENETVPIEQGTPVLSIQSLLNSSHNSFASQKSPKAKPSKNLKRKTIGTISSGKKSQRSSSKSKSFTASARRSLRSLRLDSKDLERANLSMQSNKEEKVTPKTGGVKLVQEAVKNKHSSAKKPQSKRSIIDNLNDSDIVKQLFNSPVKRKLSQSMTEFSRKKLFDDEEVRRPTRNTIAFAPRTPEESVLDNSDRYSPDNFVSPLSTPADSPNLTGIKRLYTRNTPRNDLRDVKGVKNLIRSPRTRKSVKNDLTNVSGVKNLLRGRKSVRNDLTNISGVKEVFAASPKNDLRRVSGVKSLFRAQKEKASPKNDLTDVRGVKKLLTRKSVANDLTNVSGVKKTFAKSPKNDLRDVRGVKSIFRQRKSRKDDSHDLSGVEELFNESNISGTSHRDSEALFDQLIGKPSIKAVYSKSFISKRPQKGKKSRHAKSLHASVDLITNNVEQWLEIELNKHLNKSQTVSRALQQLATDTVEGNEPILQSRVRNSTLTKSHLNVTDKKKSASEIYDAHTLPFKKRSITESLNKSSGKNKSGVNKSLLPIKKRVVHSTPVKGRTNLTMNASELGRVSPIAAVERTIAQDTTANRSTKTSPKRKGKRATKINVVFETELQVIEEPKKSPKKTAKDQTNESVKSKSVNQSQSPTRGTRAKATKVDNKVTEAKSPVTKGRKTKASVSVVTLEPEQPKAKRGRGKASTTIVGTPVKQTRRTRNNTEKQESVSKSPKPKGRRGAKATAEKSNVEEKQSPKRTRGGRNNHNSQARKDAEVTNTKRRRKSLVITKKAPVMSPKTKNTRTNLAKETESPKKSTRQTRAKLVIAKPSPKINPQSEVTQPRRGRRQAAEAKSPSPRKPAKEPPKSPKKKPSPPKRDRSANKSQDSEPPAKRGRNAKNVTIKSPKSIREKASKETAAAPTRSNRRRADPEPTENPRKRKSEDQPSVPAKVAKTARGRKAAESLVVTISPKGKRTVSPVKKATGKKQNKAASQDESIPAPRSTRRGQTQTKQSPAKRKQSPAKKELPVKKLKQSPVKKATTQAKASPEQVKSSAKKGKTSPAKKAQPSPKKAKPSPKKAKSSPKKAKASPKKAKASPNKAKPSPKKAKPSPKKAKASPKKVISSPAKKVKLAPAKKSKASPIKVLAFPKPSPVKKAEAPAKKAKASPVNKVAAALKKGKPSPAKESPVKKTRGARKAAPQIASPPASRRKQTAAASPGKVVKNTRSRRR